MMPRRSVALAFAAMMLATAMVSISPPAIAQDTVPTKATVQLVPLPNIEQRLYLRFPDAEADNPDGSGPTGTGQPDCTVPDQGVFTLRIPGGATQFGGRASCPYTLAADGASALTFTTTGSLVPNRGINFTGNSTFRYVHLGEVPQGVTLSVEVASGGTLLARGSVVGENEADPVTGGNTVPKREFNINMSLAGDAGNRGRGLINPNVPLTVTIIPSLNEDANAAGVATFRLRDTGTYLEVRGQDAVRAATWVTDELDVVKDVFAPIANNSFRPQDQDRRIVGHFAIQSAFGYDDASMGPDPTFQLFHAGAPREVGANGQTIIDSRLNLSASAPDRGLAVWTFEPGMIDYRGLPSGDYAIRVDARLHTGAPVTGGIEKKFAITSQSVTLAPFADTRIPSAVETQAHTVLPGGTTTYLLSVENTGNVNDTFNISVSAPNAAAGWGDRIGGPDVLGRSIAVPAGERRVFTLTVTAPFTSSGQVVHLVNVTSTVDPGVRSRELSLVTSIGTEVVRDISVVFLHRDLSVDPLVENLYSVYVWNRGTRVANASLEISNAINPAWKAQLVFGDAGVGRMVINGIAPGDIGAAQLRIVGPAATSERQLVRLNATNLDSPGISRDLDLTFTLRALAGVRVQVLDLVNGVGHVVELTGTNATQCPLGCDDDGVNGAWFRVWVTNTGRARDTFRLTADNFDKASGTTSSGIPCTSTAFVPPTTPTAMTDHAEFGFYARTRGGDPAGQDQLTLDPGKTGELYVWLPVDTGAELCLDADRRIDFYSFVVQAASTQNTGALGRAPAEAIARNGNNRQAGVFLEAAARDPNYSTSSPIMNLTDNTRLVMGGARPGETVRYFVRATSLASWAEYVDDDERRAPDINITVQGTEGEPDWNVSIRPVLDTAGQSNYDEINPFRRYATLSNVNLLEDGPNGPGRREAWFDREIEVRVEAPANGTAATGSKLEFYLLAAVSGTDAKSTLELSTIITDQAVINVSASPTRARAHPGEAGAFLLTLSNTGGSATTVTLEAAMAQGVTNGNLWQVTPGAQTFAIAPFTNRTIALLVTPPPTASPTQTGEVALNITYFDHPETLPNSTARAAVPRLIVDVVEQGTLQLSAPATDKRIAPGGTASFEMTVRNIGGLEVPFRVNATGIPNWTVEASPQTGRLAPNTNMTVVLVLRAPIDVKNGTTYSSVVVIEETSGGTNNFDSAAFNVSISGGQALPRISIPTVTKRVDRAGVQTFEIGIQNVGTAAGRLPLEVRWQDPRWSASIVDQRGNNLTGTGVTLGPNELALVNVTVRAPFDVPERTTMPIEIIAYSEDQTQAAKSTIIAEIHDYGVQLALNPSTKEGLPGVPTEFVARVKNTGNDNDTLNLSVNLIDLPEWSVDLSASEVRLEPGQEVEVRATVRSPTAPLPAARSYTFPFWIGTRGGQEVNLSKNMTVAAVVTIPNYRAYDVDGDGQLEVAVDLDRRSGNGFEQFREVFTEGLATQVVADPVFEGRTTYFFDIPRDTPYDGVADVWFNPETVHNFDIDHAPDINGDGTPDYLLDTDRDARLDKAFDSATERFWDVTEIKVYGEDDGRIQYLVDITGDGRPDRFYDPETRRVTRTQNADDVGADLVGIDIDDDDTVDYYYNTRTRETSGAEVQNVGSFARDHWYFFVIFAALVLLTIMLIVRRRRSG